MDPSRWIVLLRWPLEIVSLGLALSPLLSVTLAWASLPALVPVPAEITHLPHRRSNQAQAWVLPIMALIVYCLMSQASGTWAWVLHGGTELPSGAEFSLVLKPVFALLMIFANQMLMRAARRQTESLNGWLLGGLMLLLLAPPFAITIASL